MRAKLPLLMLGNFISFGPGFHLAELVKVLFLWFGLITLGAFLTPALALSGESVWCTRGCLSRLAGDSTPGHLGESGPWAACQ